MNAWCSCEKQTGKVFQLLFIKITFFNHICSNLAYFSFSAEIGNFEQI